MANFKIDEIEIQHPMFDEGDLTIRLKIRVYGKRRRFTAHGRDVTEAIEDAYFFYTGKVAYPPGKLEGNRDWVYSEENANPDDFTHIEGVPEYLELPF